MPNHRAQAAGAVSRLGTESGDHLAVRAGVVYTTTGQAKFGLPAGDYTIYAGRGFEYGIDSARISVKSGDTIGKTLSIRREVPTEGLVACDTHVHTLTHSGHGDATIDERMMTLAGEGIELPIATDHNVQIDYEATASSAVSAVFHAGGRQRGDRRSTSTSSRSPRVGRSRFQTQGMEADLRQPRTRAGPSHHPQSRRDLHGGFTPFGPKRHLALTAGLTAGSCANAMEIVNSGAHKSDMMRLVNDWFGLLNRGRS